MLTADEGGFVVFRSIFATLAALWFGFNALTFGGDLNGDASEVVWATRAICSGLALLALAAVDSEPSPRRTTSSVEG